MNYTPHEYQAFATNFIESHPMAAVFLDCGLGKTVITLTAINELMYDSFEVGRVLIIAPLRVARDTWPNEILKWEHLKGLTFSVAVGTVEERVKALNKKSDIYIINRENVEWLIAQSGFPFDFDMVVLDELSSFKNRQARRFKALASVRGRVERIVGLTGTPASNGLMDLWAEFRLLDKGVRLGRFISSYRSTYFVPDKRNAQIIFSYKAREGAEEEIYKKINDITISMKSVDHLVMPEMVVNEVKVKMSTSEEKSYKTLKDDLFLSLKEGDITAMNAASLSGKLCQLANGAIYDDEKRVVTIHDKKLDALEDIIEAANGKSVLVAYWFRHDCLRIKARLEKLKIDYESLDDAESIKRWNEGKLQVALIHPASAGHGLNLQEGGNLLVWFGLTWSLELYQQTNARLWRQGQKAKAVVIEHIVTEKTIDERILKALGQKSITQDCLLEAVKAEVRG